MSLAHCVDMVAKGDAARHRVLRIADDAAQARLYPLYALNLEIARAPWASAEPLVAEMRLQWWRDALDDLTAGRGHAAHPVLGACAFMAGDAQAGALWDALIEARRWDIWQEPFADEPALWAHLDATGGGLMELAAGALAVKGCPVLRGFGTAAALAGWLQAVPEYLARGRNPLPKTEQTAIADLARDGLARMARARASRGLVPRAALPALLTGWQAKTVLVRAAQRPGLVMAGGLDAPFAGAVLTWRALSGRW